MARIAHNLSKTCVGRHPPGTHFRFRSRFVIFLTLRDTVNLSDDLIQALKQLSHFPGLFFDPRIALVLLKGKLRRMFDWHDIRKLVQLALQVVDFSISFGENLCKLGLSCSHIFLVSLSGLPKLAFQLHYCHCHVYREHSVLLEWHDAFTDGPMYISRSIGPHLVDQFAGALGSSYVFKPAG